VPIVVAEGERAADALLRYGLVAVGTVTGADMCPSSGSLAVLEGRPVILWPDADEPGREHMQRIAAALAGVAATVRVVTPPPDVPEAWDAADTDAETAKRLVAEAVPVVVEESGSDAEDEPPVQPWVPFPLDMLPPQLSALAYHGAASIGCNAAFIAVAGLVVLAAAIGTARWALVKVGWKEPALLWALLVGRSGAARKTPALDLVAAPLQEAESRYFVAWRAAMDAHDLEMHQWKSKKNRGPKPKPPARARAILDDATLESIAIALDGSPRGVILCRDEGAGWLRGFDLYHDGGQGVDVPAWLSMYGASSVTVDRVSRVPLRLDHAFVAVLGTIQPGTARECMTPQLVEAGLGARILFVHPPERARKWTEAVVPDAVSSGWGRLVERLLAVPREVDEGGRGVEVFVPLDDEARALFASWVNELGERALTAPGPVSAALAKLEGAAARIALILRLADEPQATSIDAETMRRALGLAKWLADEQARCWALFGGGAHHDPVLDALYDWLDGREVTVRDVMRTGPRPLRKRDAAWAAVWGLVRDGRCEWVGTDFPGRGSRFRPKRGDTRSSTDAPADGHSMGWAGDSPDEPVSPVATSPSETCGVPEPPPPPSGEPALDGLRGEEFAGGAWTVEI
jgi:hypothetical protein